MNKDKNINQNNDFDIVKILNDPDIFYPGNFDSPERALAFLFGLCQEAADEIVKLRSELND